jgi:hypothetical protein
MEKQGSRALNIPVIGLIISITTGFLAMITLAIAVNTPPLSGPFCTGNCFEYPYLDIVSRFPRDYDWMFLAIFLTFCHLFLMITVHHVTQGDRRLFSFSAVVFAVMSATLLVLDYFIQISFIQPSLLAGETEGIAVLSQFNPHGIFILLEEIGLSLMISSFLLLVPAFPGSRFPGKALRITFVSAFILMLATFAAISLVHGIHREYRYEVAVITIAWFELIMAGILLSFYFYRMKKSKLN